MSKAYVLLSGGVDSSTCLGIATSTYGQGGVTALSLVYGQRHEKEIDFAAQVADHFQAEHIVRDISQVMGVGGLTDDGLEIPEVGYDELPHGVSPTYVPFRNGILLAVATGIAQADSEAKAVYYGAHAEDAENWAYPDCTPEFISAMGQAIDIGTYHQVSLRAPLSHMTKSAVIQLGEQHGVPWEKTWSCYEGRDIHCGVCPTCRARRDAFVRARVEDPTEYATDPAVGGDDE